MKDRFEIAGGTVIGCEHAKAGRNNQDAFYWTASDLAIVAVVTDGCSDAPHSEVGAKIGSRVFAECLKAYENDFANLSGLTSSLDVTAILKYVCVDSHEKFSEIMKSMCGDLRNVPYDYFLFTVMGAIVSDKLTAVFSIGDGVYCLNSACGRIGPFDNNMPPYFGYSLLQKHFSKPDFGWLNLKIHEIAATQTINSVLIGTDGIDNLIEAENSKTPGKEEIVGPISQFWENDRYFKNPDMVRRKLSLTNRTVTKINWENRNIIKEHGLLPDDTTLVVIRRKK